MVAASTNYVDHVTHRINLDRVVAHLDFNGDRLAELKRRYGRGVRIHDPGLRSSVLVTSECDVPAEELATEVDLELLDDYLARCRSHRDAALARQSDR